MTKKAIASISIISLLAVSGLTYGFLSETSAIYPEMSWAELSQLMQTRETSKKIESISKYQLLQNFWLVTLKQQSTRVIKSVPPSKVRPLLERAASYGIAVEICNVNLDGSVRKSKFAP
ncbi:MAG: hypothetical protein SGJ27_08835 [Candidatus Melainabacteria bacterium]|nr:hypothetical protein [Candidatus Melainabacteria bacterium]